MESKRLHVSQALERPSRCLKPGFELDRWRPGTVRDPLWVQNLSHADHNVMHCSGSYEASAMIPRHTWGN